MTAIAFLRHEQGMWIATDGAAWTSGDNICRGIVTKIILCPEWDCAITGRGRGGAAEDLRRQAQIADVTSFDELADRASELAREIDNQFLSVCPPHLLARADSHFSVLLCGYSRRHNAFKVYAVSTRAGSIWVPPPPEPNRAQPYALDEINGSALFLPRPSPEAAARVGLVLPDGQQGFSIADPDTYVQTVIAACRFSCGFGADLGAPTPFVGGFVQLTRLVLHPSSGAGAADPQIVLDTQITHRWPDVIGELADPERGALPWWIAPPLQLPEDQAQEVAQ